MNLERAEISQSSPSVAGPYYIFKSTYWKHTTEANLKSTDLYSVQLAAAEYTPDKLLNFEKGFVIKNNQSGGASEKIMELKVSQMKERKSLKLIA